MITILKECTEPTVIHTDQGSVFASKDYNELIKDTNIIRSMSRAGKPTDNPVNEFIKEFNPQIAYKLISGNIGQKDNKVTLPMYMAMFM